MSASDIFYCSIAELGALIDSRAISSRELIELFLGRIDRLNPRCQAFITITGDTARRNARSVDQSTGEGRRIGPMHGIPFASKDLVDIAGVKTTAGSRVLADNVATRNAHLIDRMIEAGAISLGKTNLHEFAYGATGENEVYGTVVNPHDPTRLAGGSSSGSAAAVALGLVPAAFGTDTGGSVRAPAALCGVMGLKPTIGRISTRGVIPYCWTLDHVGIIARTVDDVAMLLQTVAGHDSEDPGSAAEPVDDYPRACGQPVTDIRVGIPAHHFWERADPEILSAAARALRCLERNGASIVDVDLPSMEHCRAVSLTLQMPEALSYHRRYLDARAGLYAADFRAGLALGQCLLAEHYVRARRILSLYRRATNEVFRSVDLIVTPSTPIVAPEVATTHVEVDGVREPVGDALTRYTTFFNMSGHPAITVPSGMHSSGLPMGVQIIGRHFDEATVLRAASVIARADEFQVPRPACPIPE